MLPRPSEPVSELKAIRPSILIDGEPGFTRSSSSIHDKIPENLSPLDDAGSCQRLRPPYRRRHSRAGGRRHAWNVKDHAAGSGQGGEVVPYKILPDVVESVEQVVYSRLRLFNTARSGVEVH
jgi:hypothetical protein